jgi:pimeloyl-ACP methyl ester carboxylesterase
VSATEQALSVTRTQIAGDVYHYEYVVRVGSTPNAQLHVHRVVRERAPWVARHSRDAVMMLHGDFATFTTNFAPSASGVAPWLAARGVDVWGVDRRWAHTPADGDTSDFDGMGLDQELGDIGVGLGFARAARLVEGSSEKLNLIGFSRGGELAYFYASREATRPAPLRHVKGIVPLDVYVSLAPEDEDLRQGFCISAYYENLDLAAGVTDTPNGFQIDVGTLDASAPDEQTPYQDFFPGFSNHRVLLAFVGRTYLFFPASPLYHLIAPTLDGNGRPTGLRITDEGVVDQWLAASPPHQALREAADTDALTCGDAPLPLDLPLSRIEVPVFMLAAAGGYGEHAVYSTTQVGSTDVTTLVVRQLPVEREAEDVGHGDLLYSPDAEALAWNPLLSWLQAH